jgi:hypothetical protein
VLGLRDPSIVSRDLSVDLRPLVAQRLDFQASTAEARAHTDPQQDAHVLLSAEKAKHRQSETRKSNPLKILTFKGQLWQTQRGAMRLPGETSLALLMEALVNRSGLAGGSTL